MEKKINEQVEFIKNFRLADGTTRNTLIKLLYYLKERYYRRRDIVYKEKDLADGVYFIKEGEFEVRISVYFNRDIDFKSSYYRFGQNHSSKVAYEANEDIRVKSVYYWS